MAMNIEIKRRDTGEVLFSCERNTSRIGPCRETDLRYAVEKALQVRPRNFEFADLRGANLSGLNLRNVNFSGADLQDACFQHADLFQACLVDSDASRANFVGARMNLICARGAKFCNANMLYAQISRSYFCGADLRGAQLPSWVPTITNIHQKVYNAAREPGALEMKSFHSNGYCGTTHCRAGWVNVLAGPAGRALEGVWGPDVAAAMIYIASDPGLECIPDFYSTDAEALIDMELQAEKERKRFS